MTAPAGSARSSRWLGRRYLFTAGGFKIPSYSAMLYLGCVIGISAGAAVAGMNGLDPMRSALAATALLVPALIGSRLWYVAQNLNVYRAAPRRIWRRGEGGSALDGGIVLMVAASVPLLGIAGLPFWRFWDATSISLLVAVIVARFGCLMHGCCAGRATEGPLGRWLPNHRGEWRRRFPTPLMESAWCLAILAAALTAGPHLPFPGALFLSVVASYGAGRVVLQSTRESADPSRNFRVSVASTAVAVAVPIAIMVYRWQG